MQQELDDPLEVRQVHYAVEPKPRPEDTTVRYGVDTRASSLTVRAFATGLLATLGHNPTIAVPDFKGDVYLDPVAIEKSQLRMVIDPASMIVTDDINEKDCREINRRMHEEVLDTDSYPEIIYECSRLSASSIGAGQYWIALNGTLSLRGVSRTQAVSARVILTGDLLRTTGEVSIRLNDYGIPPVSAVGGTIRLKDEIKLSFDISARKQA